MTPLLIEALEDWLHVDVLAWAARVAAPDAEDRITAAVDLLRPLLDAALLEAGDVTDAGFEPWPLAPADALARIERDWRALGESAHVGDVVWLRGTPAGLARARAELAELEARGVAYDELPLHDA